jgi:hypothetical protein
VWEVRCYEELPNSPHSAPVPSEGRSAFTADTEAGALALFEAADAAGALDWD